jgi:CDP-diacylglycerol--glycerol-3-phosphate 3-phosphatidyltransferase
VSPLDLGGYLDRWQELHGGYDPRTGSVWLRRWLVLVFRVGRPLARLGVPPDAVTLSTLVVAGDVVGLARVGGSAAVGAGLLVVVSGLLDNVDGCVAVLQDRVTRWGYVLDSVVDRLTDSAYLWAAVLLGCPVGVAVVCGLACFLLEYVRARAGNAGGSDVGRITVAERPTRVIVLAPTLVVAGFVEGAALLGVAVLLGLTLVGLGQLVVVVRRQLA